MAHLRHGVRDSAVDAALDAMDADALREHFRALIPCLDDATQTRLMTEVVDRAATAPLLSVQARVEGLVRARRRWR